MAHRHAQLASASADTPRATSLVTVTPPVEDYTCTPARGHREGYPAHLLTVTV